MKSWILFATFLLLATITSLRLAPRARSHVEPALINTCLITNDMKALTAFYSQVLQIEPHKSGDDDVEFPTKVGTLALFAATAQQKYIPESAMAGQNCRSILEFQVGNVDEAYARLQPLVKSWVKDPTTQPWGRDRLTSAIPTAISSTSSRLRRQSNDPHSALLFSAPSVPSVVKRRTDISPLRGINASKASSS